VLQRQLVLAKNLCLEDWKGTPPLMWMICVAFFDNSFSSSHYSPDNQDGRHVITSVMNAGTLMGI
jgi:hypothetical protein